jgi:dTDP-4-dehydrorhamnose reductase
MKFLVTGVKGQLGYDVIQELNRRGYHDIIGIDIQELDITKENNVHLCIVQNNPDVIIHCAAFTAVDKAEEMSDLCYKVNVLGTRYLTEAANEINAKILYISTDYVFDGAKEGLYEANDKPNPISVYGQTKYDGELEIKKYDKHFIIRISWVFGKNGNNFVKTMVRLGKEKDSLNIVNDQFGSPTYTKDLSRLIVDMAVTEKYGTYHATNEGVCTWYEFTKEIFRLMGITIPVYPITTNQYPTIAKRPMNSKMSKSKLDESGFQRLRDWKMALKDFLNEIEAI